MRGHGYGVEPFNRTSLELKPAKAVPQRIKLASFNRTSLELKLGNSCFVCRTKTTFNRTSLELKRNYLSVFAATGLDLLIEPVWN